MAWVSDAVQWCPYDRSPTVAPRALQARRGSWHFLNGHRPWACSWSSDRDWQFFPSWTVLPKRLSVNPHGLCHVLCFGGILFGFVSSAGATLALLIVDWRLRRSRFVQGAIAGAGALVPAIGLFVYIGQYATGGFQAAPLLLAVVFTCAFALTVFRAKKHRATPN